MDELLSRHRKEVRDLQSQITQKKKLASKKSRKTVNEECIKLEQDLKSKHAQELSELDGTNVSGQDDNAYQQVPTQEELLDSLLQGDDEESQLNNQTKNLDLSVDSEDQNAKASPPSKKPNRQKARLARRAAEQEALATEAVAEASNLPDLKEQERQKMVKEFTKRGLIETEIAANGHCLYSAIADQIHQLGRQVGDARDEGTANGPSKSNGLQANEYKIVRATAAKYISEHQDDFVPFLEEPMADYLHKVRDTGEWGGQLELLAVAKSYSIDIHVLQADGRVEKIEGNTKAKGEADAWLAYYRHGFGLGEHYNSLRSKNAAGQEPSGD